MTKRILLVAVLVVTLAASMLMTSCGSKPEYDPMQYVQLEYKYFNGEGMALPVVTPPPTTDTTSSKVIELLKETRFNYSPDRKLSNGDVVTVVPVCDEDEIKKQGFKPVLEAVEFTVAGLPEGIEVDLWEWTDFISGESGRAFILSGDKTDKNFLGSFSFSADKSIGLSNGDIVTVTITYNEEKALELGYKIISKPTKQFVFNNLNGGKSK